MGMPLVFGRKKITKRVITAIQPRKKTKMPNFIEHNIDRNDCAMRNVKRRFVETVIDWPADRASSGKISVGMSHSNGPQDHAKPETNKQISTTTAMELEFGQAIEHQ
jgi:hypothetical protein